MSDTKTTLTETVEIDTEKSEEKELESFIEGDIDDAPEDKNSFVYLIIFLHGIGTLMPWNMFLTIASSYYVHYKMAERVDINGTLSYEPGSLSTNYMTAQNVCSQIPNLILNFVNIFIVVKGDLTKRIGVSLCVVGFCVLLTMSFIFADTWTWQTGFFVVTLVSIVGLNAANGVYQNSIFGLASDFPFKYTNAVIIGNNFCGTFVSIISIIAIYIFADNTPLMAFVYFGISLATIVCCFCSFFLLKKLEFYRYYAITKKALKKTSEDESRVTFADFVATFKEGWVGFTNVFLIFFVTLAIFPETMMGVVPDAGESLVDALGNLYISIMVFLLFNSFAFIGSMLASWKQLISPRGMAVWVYARLLLIPAFLLLNYRPATRGWIPVLSNSVYLYAALGIVMSVSSGYLSSLAMMYIPRYVSAHRTRAALMMGAFFLIGGIVCGVIGGKLIALAFDFIGSL